MSRIGEGVNLVGGLPDISAVPVGQRLLKNSSADYDLRWGDPGQFGSGGFVYFNGTWYANMFSRVTSPPGTTSITFNYTYYLPVYLYQGLTIAGVGIGTNASGSYTMVGSIVAMNSTTYGPGNTIYATKTQSGTITSGFCRADFTSAVYVPAGWSFIAFSFSAGPSAFYGHGSATYRIPWGFPSDPTTSPSNFCFTTVSYPETAPVANYSYVANGFTVYFLVA